MKQKDISGLCTVTGHFGKVFAPARAPQPHMAVRVPAWSTLPGFQEEPALFDDAEIILLIEAVNVNDY